MMKLVRLAAVSVLLASAACRVGGNGGGDGEDEGVAATIGPEGGTVSLGSVALELEPGSVPSRTVVTITPVSDVPEGNVGPAYDFQPEGVTFDPPAVITFAYDESLLGGRSPEELSVATVVGGAWEPVGAELDVERSEVRATLPHFSVYSLILPPLPPTDGDGDVDGDADADGGSCTVVTCDTPGASECCESGQCFDGSECMACCSSICCSSITCSTDASRPWDWTCL
jgi:hypothetical protein